MKRATFSLPVPLSPVISTVLSVGPIFSTRRRTRFIASETPMICSDCGERPRARLTALRLPPPPARSPLPHASDSLLALVLALRRIRRPQVREEENVADVRLAGQQHDEPVDADPDAGRRRHAVLHRGQELLVERLRLLVPHRAPPRLLLEPAR